MNAFKRQLQMKPEKTANSKKRKAESLLFNENNLTASSDEGENKKYLFTSSKPFSSSKTKLAKSSNPITELVVSLIVNNEEHMLIALADTGASIISILEAYISAPFIKTGDSNTNTWITMSGKFTTIKLGYDCDIFIPRVQSRAKICYS
jgi:hypothetical protein